MHDFILTTVRNFILKIFCVYSVTIPNSVYLLRTHILFKKILGMPTYIGCFITNSAESEFHGTENQFLVYNKSSYILC